MIYITTYPLTQRINPMRKLLLTAAAVAAAMGLACAAEPTGTLTDARDGQKYRTVVIGGKRWMARNLNYKTDSSWCYGDGYDDKSSDYCKEYGRLYVWNAALKACPSGYHLSTNQEWRDLITAVGGNDSAGKILKMKSGWPFYYYRRRDDKSVKSGSGTDVYGFSALPGGRRGIYSGGEYYYSEAVSYGLWWTATPENRYPNEALYQSMALNEDDVFEDRREKNEGLSVRCVADTP